jgi:uncharacterized protein (DUF885 family)
MCKSINAVLLALLSILSAQWSTAGDADALRDQLSADAQTYMEALLEAQQPMAYFSDLPLERHDRFFDNSPAGLARLQAAEDTALASLRRLSTSDFPDPQLAAFYANFRETLESEVELRICKAELWGVNHMNGAQVGLDLLVRIQPVASADDKQDALSRWQHAAAYFDQEIDNLERGLQQGYSAPKRVVQRVITQLEAITNAPAGEHPYMALTQRADDPAFTVKFQTLLEKQLLPALDRYRTYLAEDYLPRAREALGIHAIPRGRECYIALYRHYTSLQRTPEQVYQLGLATVEGNKQTVKDLGKAIYGTDSFSAAVATANSDTSQTFKSPEAMHAFYVAVVERAKATTLRYFYTMPAIKLVVQPIPPHQQGSGQSAHYLPGTPERPAEFAYDPTTFAQENFGSAEIVSVHEGYPGHHLQIALVQGQEAFHPLQGSFWSSAYGEGWARYAEALAEEAGIYRSKSARILRRSWPARGMVADPGMHLLGWSNEQVAEFLRASGAPHIAEDPDKLMDRMATIPAQLTSYDSGALEIFALRELLQQARGDRFDLKEFHQLILQQGSVPLSLLREQVERAGLRQTDVFRGNKR